VAKALGVSGHLTASLKRCPDTNRGDPRIIRFRKSSTRAKPCWQKKPRAEGRPS